MRSKYTTFWFANEEDLVEFIEKTRSEIVAIVATHDGHYRIVVK